jgi:hypothetical protein
VCGGSEDLGTLGYNQIISDNVRIAAIATSTPGGQYFDVRAFLVSFGTTGEKARDVPACALMAADQLHTNTKANYLIAQNIVANYLPALIASSTSQTQVVTYSNLNTILQSPPTIGSQRPADAYFNRVVINSPASSTFNGGVNVTTQVDQRVPLRIFGLPNLEPINGGYQRLNDYAPDSGHDSSPLVELFDSSTIPSDNANWNETGSLDIRGLLSSLQATFVGSRAGARNGINAVNNTGFGFHAIASDYSGIQNTAVGSYALSNIVAGSNNTAVGYLALGSTTASTSMNYNTAIGASAGGIGGQFDTYVGASAGNPYDQSSYTTAIGYTAGLSLLSGVSNTFIGTLSGQSFTTGDQNTCIGYQACALQTSGTNNLVIGARNQTGSTTGSNQISIGNIIYATNANGIGPVVSTGGISIGSSLPPIGAEASTTPLMLSHNFSSNGTALILDNQNVATNVQTNLDWTLAINTGGGIIAGRMGTIYPSTNNIGFEWSTFNGSLNQRMQLNPTGELGIGLNLAPTVQLDVQSSTTAASATGTIPFFRMSRPTNGGASFEQAAAFALGSYATNGAGNGYGPSTRVDLNLKSIATDDLNADKSVMTWLANGNTGVGTTSPSTALQVVGNISTASSTAPTTSYNGQIVCYLTVGTTLNVLGHMTQSALLAGAGSATCIQN